VRFDVSGRGALRGRVEPPGDTRLTLSVMAFGFLSGAPVTVLNPSPSPAVAVMRSFCGRNGCPVDTAEGGLTTHGSGAGSSDVDVSDVPDDAMHIVIPGCVFSGRRVTVGRCTGRRLTVLTRLIGLLGSIGLDPPAAVEGEEGSYALDGARFSPPAIVTVRSSWEFEAAAAAALAAEKDVVVSYPAPVVSHSLKVLGAVGFRPDESGEERGRDAEIARRLSRKLSETPPEIRRFSPTGELFSTVAVPGDTVLAAAVTGVASLIPKSDVVVGNVLWEQSRRGFFETLRRMKASVSTARRRGSGLFDAADITVGWGDLENVHVTPDQARTFRSELMLLGALAAFARGETVISDCTDEPGVGRDAFSALSRGLEMMGAHVGDYADGFVVRGSRELRGNLVDSNGHPGAALGFALAGANAGGSTSIFGFDADDHPVGAFLSMLDELEK